jgi:hypothetical protein
MKRHLHAVVPAIVFAWLFTSCSKTSDTKDLTNWIGDYVYKEDPVEAVQGIYRNMVWQLSIQLQNDTCRGILELMGDRTYVKALTTIQGDSNYVDVVFNKLLDGTDENLMEGETLFSMTRDSGRIVTTWDRLEPRLEEFPTEECVCFASKKKKKTKKKKAGSK